MSDTSNSFSNETLQNIFGSVYGYYTNANPPEDSDSPSHKISFVPLMSPSKTDVAQRLNSILEEEEINFEMDSSSQPHEEKYLKLNCMKSISELGWMSKMNIEKTLLLTLNWYAEFMKGNNMKEFTEKQIDEFIAE